MAPRTDLDDPAVAAAALRRAAAAGVGGRSSDFDLLPGAPRPAGAGLRPAAVLLAVDLAGPRACLLLTKRATHLRHHPGQIALPGGRLEPGEDAAAAALREGAEETGLPLAAAETLGTLPPHETVTGFSVTPVLALIHARWTPLPQPGEVEEVFHVPLACLADPDAYRQEGRSWQGRARRYWVAPWGPHYVWGATARILLGLARRL
jgi:8-oxo-dGTP pyrophosphatase MutT (NUDIX family)